MLIKNITDKFTPKPISIGKIVLMPGESIDVPDETVYVDEFDRVGKKTGKKIILPAIVLLAGMDQITYEETKAPVKKQEVVEEEPIAEEEQGEEVPVVKRTRRSKKAE